MIGSLERRRVNRREFIKTSGLLAAVAGLPPLVAARSEDDPFGLLEPVDLLDRIRLGQQALTGCLDPSRAHLPYWKCDIAHRDLTTLTHAPYDGEGVWDRLHNAGRALHGLTMAEQASGVATDPGVIADLARILYGLFSTEDGLPSDAGTPTGKRVASLHNLREVLNGLTALAKRGEAKALASARQLVRTLRRLLDDEGRLQRVRLPSYAAAYTNQPHMEGRTVDALVRYYRLSKDDVALETAALIANCALRSCFTTDGRLTAAAGTHGHSINVMVAGMAELALETSNANLLAGTRQAFDVGLKSFNSSFGWSEERLYSKTFRGEINNTGDLLRAALLLGRAGWTDYYRRSERILRGHLLASQLRRIDDFSNDPFATEDRRRSLAARVRGGFGVPAPHDRQSGPAEPLCIYDITSGAVDALCEAYQAALEIGPRTVRLNLQFSLDRQGVRVRSEFSRHGRVVISDPAGRDLAVRVPPWAAAEDLKAFVNGRPVEPAISDSYVRIAARPSSHQVELHFPLRTTRSVETIVGQPFTLDWRGDQIVAMSPPSAPDPDGTPLPPAGFPMFPPCR